MDAAASPLGSGRAKLTLGAAALLVLLLGLVLAPPPTQVPLAAPEQTTAPLLEERVQRRAVDQPPAFDLVADAAARGRMYTQSILPGGFAVFVTGQHLLTHGTALDGEVAVQLASPDGRVAQAQAVVLEPGTGLVLLQTEGTPVTAAPIATTPAEAGALAVAVGRFSGRDLAVPVFITESGGETYRLGPIGGAVMPGMPIFNLAGELLAIAAATDGTDLRAYPAGPAVDRLLAMTAPEPEPTTDTETAPQTETAP